MAGGVIGGQPRVLTRVPTVQYQQEKSGRTRRSVVHDLSAGEEQEAVKERKGVKVRLVNRADDEYILLLGEAADYGGWQRVRQK